MVADDDDSGGSLTSKVTFNAIAGTTYQIAVDGYNAASGNITLHVTRAYYTVALDSGSTTPALTVGVPYTISGTIRRNGTLAANATVGMHDGLSMISRTFTTDANGRFSIRTTPVDDKAAYVEFLDPSGVVFANFAYNVMASGSRAGSVWLRDLRLVNDTGYRQKAIVSGATGSPNLEYILEPGQEVSVLRSNTGPAFTFNPSLSSGVIIPFEVLGTGASVSTTVDTNGVGKVRVTAGAGGLLRFSLYGTTNFDGGLCWSPGGQIVPGAGGSGHICIGSEGIGIGGTLNAGYVVTGLSVQLLRW
jgi:hypothetical protein